MRTLLATILCVCILAGFSYFVVETTTPKIMAQLESDITQQLTQHHLASIQVSVDGRDVTLHGELETQEQISQAIKVASHRPGVRIVMNNMRVTEK